MSWLQSVMCWPALRKEWLYLQWHNSSICLVASECCAPAVDMQQKLNKIKFHYPNVKKKKEKPKMVGVLEVVRYQWSFRNKQNNGGSREDTRDADTLSCPISQFFHFHSVYGKNYAKQQVGDPLSVTRKMLDPSLQSWDYWYIFINFLCT